MKIALLNAFPNLRYSAEREFITRSISVLRRLGHEAIEVLTSDEILAFDPTFVIITHEFVPKTTHYYTIGLLWSPTQFYKDDPQRVKAIRSWDLVVPINSAVRRFARDLHFPRRHTSAVSSLNFYPSAPVADVKICKAADLTLAYVGVHWDGNRHERLFRALSETVELHVYGPPSAWEFLPNNYRGTLPFDGDAVIRTLNRHGAVLAIHKGAHIEEDTPSMRVFEACAAKCLVITDPLKPLLEMFGNSLSYVDVARNPEVIAQEIAEVIDRHRRDPEVHINKVLCASEAFETKASLEKLFSDLLEEVDRRIREDQPNSAAEEFDVTVIVRCGSRPLSMLRRSVSSLSKQTYRRLGIIFARYANINGFEAWLEELRRDDRFLFVIDLEAPGDGVRSGAMWAGLRAVETELFCMLDDDDELFPNHINDLVGVLRKSNDASVAYSGVVRQEEDGRFLNNHVRFKGDTELEIRERRDLFFFHDFSLDRLLKLDNFIQSNTWLARKRVLTPDILDDPELEVQEDLYFYLLLASRYEFAFSGAASALWNWRSLADDNTISAVSSDVWRGTRERLLRRLSQVPFRGGFLGKDVLGIGRLIDQGVRSIGTATGNASYARRRFPPIDFELLGERLLKLGGRIFPGQVLLRLGIWGASGREADYTIDFCADRLPHFVVDSHGLSHVEPWGRWTVGSRLFLKFRHPLPRQFALRIHGRAFESNNLRPLTILVGKTTKTLTMSSQPNYKTYQTEIANDDLADSITLNIPNSQSPARLWPGRSDDHRRLGLALVRIEIFEKCS
jgi:hypothetical protein